MTLFACSTSSKHEDSPPMSPPPASEPAPASTPGQPNFMTPAQLERFKARAKADGTYWPAGSCPSTAADLTGAVVWVEQCSAQYANNMAISIHPCSLHADPGIGITLTSIGTGKCTMTASDDPTDRPDYRWWQAGRIHMFARLTIGPGHAALYESYR